MIDVENAIARLGIDYEVKGSEATALCPMHKKRTGKEDHSPSWWINLSTGQHICFSCQYKGSLLLLVCDLEGMYLKSWGGDEAPDYASAKAWLAKAEDISPEKMAEILRNIPTRIEAAPKPLEMSEARLAVFVDPPQEHLDSRKISLDAAQAYEILWDKTREAWVLPFRDPATNKLLGWQEKGTRDRTFMNRPPGLPRSRTVFGLNCIREDVAYVVESPLDAARFHTAGFPGAVAVCGSSVHEDQIKLLRQSGVVIAAFDNPKIDKAGKKASDEIRKWALKYGLNLLYFNYGDTGKKDAGDLTNEEIAWGVENAKSFLFGEQAYV